MPAYVYDDFEIALTARADGTYDLNAVTPDRSHFHTTFKMPPTAAELVEAAAGIARVRSRRATAPPTDAPPGTTGTTTREAPAADGVVSQGDKSASAEQLGAALAGALFADGIGDAYDEARVSNARASRGVRLTLSLAGAPALLSLPWEFLFRRPRFLANSRHTPVVRRLDAGVKLDPVPITGTVRILGVVSNPNEFARLDVRAEQRRVEKAVSTMKKAGRVELKWLPSATPESLRQALLDEYHVLHYIGHSSFTEANDGAIYLRNADGSAAEVDGTKLANMLSDQNSMRLVVLNSCEGARTTLSDPYAGVATTLIQLGMPAVVAMQFEISDEAAQLFSAVMYENLVGRRDPIDAAVSEARKAIYVQLDQLEWATPVLFMRDPNLALFEFADPTPVIPPAEPADLTDEIKEIDEAAKQTGGDPSEPGPPVTPPPGSWAQRLLRKPAVVIGVVAALAAATIGVVAIVDPDPSTPTTLAPTTPAPTTAPSTTVAPTTTLVPVVAGNRTLAATVQVDDDSTGRTQLFGVDRSTGAVASLLGAPNFQNSDASWAPGKVNRVAFTGRSGGVGSAIYSAIPDARNRTPTGALALSSLVALQPGVFAQHPVWAGASGTTLWYFTANGPSGPGWPRPSTRRRSPPPRTATSRRSSDPTRSGRRERSARTFDDVTAITADSTDPGIVYVADSKRDLQGAAHRRRRRGHPFVHAVDVLSMAQTTNGYIVAVVQPASGDPQLVAYDEVDGTLAATADPRRRGTYQLVTLESQSVLLVLVRHDDGTSRRRTCRSRPTCFGRSPTSPASADVDLLAELERRPRRRSSADGSAITRVDIGAI